MQYSAQAMTELDLYLFNTATRQKEKFITQEENVVKFYSCGQTVYEDVHVGNAKTYIVWDVLVRLLRHLGYKVIHVQNFTDLGHLTDDADEGEDKIVRRAKILHKDPMELVDEKINMYNLYMDKINVNRPNIAPRATGHIIEMIDMIKILLDKGHAYEHEGSIYFDIKSFPKYGALAKLDLDNLLAGARVDVIEGKKNPGDFALWINAPRDHIMQYTSPWGKGYPGWHIECSVMAQKYLGETIDIHAGGIDHIPVHHTNEIAQSEGTTGKQFANYWIHSAFITINGEKMSKSKNNFHTLEDLVNQFGSGVARFSLMEAHYRTQSDFSIKQTLSIKKRYNRIVRSYHLALQSLHGLNSVTPDPDDSEKIYNNFIKAMLDDMNVPLAISHLNSLVKRMDQLRKKDETDQLRLFVTRLEELMGILGIPLIPLTNDEISRTTEMVNLRIRLKKSGDYQASDSIRDHLQFSGYVLQDLNADETQWYREKI